MLMLQKQGVHMKKKMTGLEPDVVLSRRATLASLSAGFAGAALAGAPQSAEAAAAGPKLGEDWWNEKVPVKSRLLCGHFSLCLWLDQVEFSDT